MNETNALVTSMVGELTSDHREMSTPCDEWSVHDLIGHMCGGVQGIVGGLQGQTPPEEAPHFLAEGPAAGWAAARSALEAVATPETMAAMHQMPFARAEGRSGGFKSVVDVGTDASALDQLLGYTGRKP